MRLFTRPRGFTTANFWHRLATTATTALLAAAVLPANVRAADPAAAAGEPLPEKVRFNRDIRPVLSENCFACHGFDPKERKADLRLDTAEGLVTKLDGGAQPVVPGDPARSKVWQHITAADKDELMPPPKTGKVLTARQKALIKRWIEQGAAYEAHWSFVTPVRPELPRVKNQPWVRNPIDQFILARLEREGLKPAAEADKVTLIRRVTLDLIGLPPTIEEVEQFVADKSPDAYEKLIDRLMARPQYGERMALDWLDAGRYADTHGFHIDSGRDMTRWREWVIDAFWKNKPYDQFVVEQFAGDLLPNPTIDQQVATGFHRNHMINFEGGADPQEYHTAYLIDRVNTTGSVVLGLTVGCAQCHDHKYDPITQKDYYGLYAFFNNVPENGLDGNKGNAVPFIRTPTAEQKKKLDELAAAVKAAEAKLGGADAALDAEQLAWEKSLGGPAGPATWAVLEPTSMKSAGGAHLKALDDKSILATGNNPGTETYTLVAPTALKNVTAIKVEALPDDSLPSRGPGRSPNGNAVMTEVRLATKPVGDAAASPAPLKFKAASADYSQELYPVAHAIDAQPNTGWALYPQVGKPHEAVFELEQPLANEAGRAVLTIDLDFRSQFGQHQFGRFRVSVTDAKQPHGNTGTPPAVAAILAVAPEARSEQQKAELRTHYRTNVSPAGRQLGEQVAKLKKEQQDLEATAPTTMVMQEMPQPRDTFMLVRGAFDKKGEKVAAAVPSFLPPLPAGAPANRLGLARWLVSKDHPLTSRVAVNRYWQMYFGTGIVNTADDFGVQGELPSHPELLDWLAVEFREGGWDVNKLVKLFVTSATYRQSSAAAPALIARDPENRLLARGPRFRLQAEFIRDQALAVAGLLDGRVGGPSVSPYQPAGLWEELMSRADGANWSAQTYVQSKGPDLYRRTMYTFWKRTSPPPSLATFDAPDRETCTVRRARTNTPLQALVLMNDPTYVEASRKLAERMMTDPRAGASAEDRIAFAFRLTTARRPTPEEVAVLKRIFDEQSKAYAADQDGATKLLSVGESPRDQNLPAPDLAAWTTVASVILNLDETITRG